MDNRKNVKDRSPTKVLIVATISHIMQHIYVGSSVLLPLIVAELNLNYTEFGLAIAISSLAGGLSQILFSAASRKIARNILLGLGNILLSLGTFITSLSHRLIDFLGARLISNIGVAPQHPMGTAIISEKFNEKSLGRAIGF
ncbi:MFS transporter, partial [Candidatus Bathyarchaeota archaeon]|nr:MFS transporter [Candidatus Bathyarchaeota archaeon]